MTAGPRVEPTRKLFATMCVLLVSAWTTPTNAWPGGEESTCSSAISPDDAQQIFNRLRGPSPDSCTFQGVSVDRRTATVKAKTRAGTIESAQLTPTGCSGPEAIRGERLSLTAPKSLASSCPAFHEKMLGLLDDKFVTETVSAPSPPADADIITIPWLRRIVVGVSCALALFLAGWLETRLRRRPSHPFELAVLALGGGRPLLS